jgi:xanthine dehydrogenase accessory factor
VNVPGDSPIGPGTAWVDKTLAAHWLTRAVPAMLVRVGATRGSVPREVDTCMLVSATEVAGTVGGGHLEWQAIATARERLAAGQTAHHAWPVALGPSLGQCCGGTLTLSFSPLTADTVAAWPVAPGYFQLQLYGAGHVGRAVIRLLAQIPCRVSWIDERAVAFPAGPLPAHIQTLCVEPVQAEVALAPPGAYYLVMTHNHDLDLALTQTILQRSDVGWFGLIGSATKRARFEARLRQRGFPDPSVARMVCPVGLPGLAGKEPGVIAASVVAQMLLQASAKPAQSVT